MKLFAKHDVRATFFVLGWVADRCPQLIRDIHAAGHEIGCHSYWHRLVYDLTPEQFRDDLHRSCDVIEKITGTPVTQYRAPSFSITEKSMWAFDIMAKRGINCDSSIFPIYHDRYGVPNADPHPHVVETDAGVVWEFPASVHRLCNMNFPATGGGYFRLYPSWLSRYVLRKYNAQTQRPFMFYVHPWEIDPEQPRMQGSLKSRWRHYQNLESTESKLADLIYSFNFGTLTESLAADMVAQNVAQSEVEGITAPASEKIVISSSSRDDERPENEPTVLSKHQPNVLYVTHRVPYPPNRGDRIRNYNILKHLAARSNVSLACFADEEVTDETQTELNRLCQNVEIIPVDRFMRWGRAAASFGRGATLSQGLFESNKLAETIRDWQNQNSFDAALVSSSALAQYLESSEFKSVPAFVDLIDVDSQKWLDYSESSSWPKSRIYRTEGQRLRRYEAELGDWTNGLAVVSEQEAMIYRSFRPDGPIRAIPNGVDIDYFTPTEQDAKKQSGCVFVGALDYLPNVQGITWFCEEIWPAIHEQLPDQTIQLVGREPVAEVQKLDRIAGVKVVGTVDDVRPYMANASVAVVPLQIARGVQNKVLEAMAMSKAIVASPQSLVGLNVEDGVHAIAAETKEQWVNGVVDLTLDTSMRADLGLAALSHVTAYYRWDRCLDPLMSFLGLQSKPESLTSAELETAAQ